MILQVAIHDDARSKRGSALLAPRPEDGANSSPQPSPSERAPQRDSEVRAQPTGELPLLTPHSVARTPPRCKSQIEPRVTKRETRSRRTPRTRTAPSGQGEQTTCQSKRIQAAHPQRSKYTSACNCARKPWNRGAKHGGVQPLGARRSKKPARHMLNGAQGLNALARAHRTFSNTNPRPLLHVRCMEVGRNQTIPWG